LLLGASLLGGLAAAGAAGGELSGETVAAYMGPEPPPPVSSQPTTTTPAPTTTTTQPPAPTTTAAQPQVVVAATPNPVPATGTSVEAAIRQWFPENYAAALRIARCESGLNPRAVGGGNSYGLFQIHHVHRRHFTTVTGVAWEAGWFDPFHNAHYARNLYNGSGWGPWACA
jgi:hypothetical protein